MSPGVTLVYPIYKKMQEFSPSRDPAGPAEYCREGKHPPRSTALAALHEMERALETYSCLCNSTSRVSSEMR